MSFYLAIVSPTDTPLYETALQSARSQPAAAQPSSNASSPSLQSAFPSWSSFTGSNGSDLGPPPGDGKIGGNLGLVTQGGAAGGASVGGLGAKERHAMQMVVHKSLDSVDEIVDSTGSLYLRNVDRHNEWTVSAFIAGNVRLVLLHDVKNDDGIRQFFVDVWESYVKVALNPFHTVNTLIRSPAFDSKVKAAAKRSL